MKRQLPPINALRAFEAAARSLSFKEAADELSVTPAAVSQHVKSLEAYCGVPLFIRRTRAIELTQVARAALPHLTNGFDRLAEGAAELRAQSRSGILVVSVPPSFGAKWLVPRLERFHAAYPNYSVRLDATEALATFAGDGVDLAIRYGHGAYGDLLMSERIISETAQPVCSPGLLANGRGLSRPDDLQDYPLLHVNVSDTHDVFPTWQMWLQAVGASQVDALRGPTFNVASMAVDAAIAGQGVALAGETLVERDIAAGRLVYPFARAESEALQCAYYLVYPRANEVLPKIVAFRAWLRDELEHGDRD